MSAINPFRETIRALKEFVGDDSQQTGVTPKKKFLRLEYNVDGASYLKSVNEGEVGCYETFLANFNCSPINLSWVVDLLLSNKYRDCIQGSLHDSEWNSVNTAFDILNERIDRYNIAGLRPYDKSLRLVEIRRFCVPTAVSERLLKAEQQLSPRGGTTPTPSASASSTTFAFSAAASSVSSSASASVSAVIASPALGVAAPRVQAPTVYASMDLAVAKEKLEQEIAKMTTALKNMRTLTERDVASYRARVTDVANGMSDVFKATPPADLKANFDLLNEYLSACELCLKAQDYTFSFIYDKIIGEIRRKSSHFALMNCFSVALDLHGTTRKADAVKGVKAAVTNKYSSDELSKMIATYFVTYHKNDSKLKILLAAAILGQNRSLDRAVVEHFNVLDGLFKATSQSLKYLRDKDEHKVGFATLYSETFLKLRALLDPVKDEAALLTAMQKIKTNLLPKLEKQLERAIRSHSEEFGKEARAMRVDFSALQAAQKTKKALPLNEYLFSFESFGIRLQELAAKSTAASSEKRPSESVIAIGKLIKAIVQFERSLATVRSAKFNDSNLDAAVTEYISREQSGSELTWPSLAHIYAFSKEFSMRVVLSQKVANVRNEDSAVTPYLPVIAHVHPEIQLNFLNHQSFELHVETRESESDNDEEIDIAGDDDDVNDSTASALPARTPLSVDTSRSPGATPVATTPASVRQSQDVRGMLSPVAAVPAGAKSPVSAPTPMGLAAFSLLSPTAVQQQAQVAASVSAMTVSATASTPAIAVVAPAVKK